MKRAESTGRKRIKLGSFRFLFLVIIAVAIVGGCKRDLTPDGPNLQDRFGPFNVVSHLTISRDSVDFTGGQSVVFNAQFNKNVNWIITIVGNDNGAIKKITGFSKDINSSNATWTGTTTTLPLFKPEQCSVQLTIPEEPNYLDTGAVKVLTPHKYPGTLFTDFETDQSANMQLGNYEFELTSNSGRTNSITAAQGDYCYFLQGTDNVVSNFFVGLVNIFPEINNTTYVELPTYVPDNVYFNFFLYNDGSPHGIAVVQFAYDSNNNGQYDDGVDQLIQLTGDYPMNFTGWKQYSNTMAQIGLTEAQMHKIVAIRVLLISDKNNQPNPPNQVELGIDYMIFTVGSPLQI